MVAEHNSRLIPDYPPRFEKNDILRIVRALAIFRPSLIALQMPLTEEDEIFVEKCVQRSVIVSGNECSGRAFVDHHAILSGIEQAHILQWHSHCRMAEDRRDMPRRARVLYAYRMEQGGTVGKKEVYLGGERLLRVCVCVCGAETTLLTPSLVPSAV
jgi:hypothetical protein